MYKFSRNRQIKLTDFNMPAGLKLNMENRWIMMVDTIPWDAIEEKYACWSAHYKKLKIL